jgi:predicted TIM-barrel fold metal-dependent hydrolase
MSSDNHAGASSAVYREYLESSFLPAYDEWIAAQAGKMYGNERDPDQPKSMQEEDDRASFGMNLGERLAKLEEEGIVGEVLFSNPGAGPLHDDLGVPFAGMLGGTSGTDFDVLAAGQRAHNRWQAETADLTRQVGLALISFHDVDAAVQEIERSSDAGLRGISLQGVHPDLPPLDDPVYEPMWAVCAERDLPVHFHEVSGALSAGRVTGPRTDGPVNFLDPIAGYERAWFGHRPFWFLILGGVLERHPRLRVVFSEMGTEWAIESLRDLDRRWTRARVETTPEPPSFYYQRQVFFGFSRISLHEVRARHEAGVDKLMWGGDHPHISGSWTCTPAYVRAFFGAEGVSEQETRAILGETAVEFYGLDPAPLRAAADRVGPTADELLREPDLADRELISAKVSGA